MTGRPAAADTATKVAAVTLAFWVMKICATTAGETVGDLLSMTMDLGYLASSALLVGLFGVAVAVQLGVRRFHPFLYWTVILATSTAGTTMSDYMDRTLGLGYAAGAAILVGLLVLVLLVWKMALGSIAVDHIRERKAEAFYWAAILVSNTLGTALGDYLADSSGLGYGLSNLIIAAGIGLCVAGYFLTRIPRTALFWAAFVLTRPFGATMGDFLTKDPVKGGLGFGTLGSSAVLLVILAAVLVFDTRRKMSAAPSA